MQRETTRTMLGDRTPNPIKDPLLDLARDQMSSLTAQIRRGEILVKIPVTASGANRELRVVRLEDESVYVGLFKEEVINAPSALVKDWDLQLAISAKDFTKLVEECKHWK